MSRGADLRDLVRLSLARSTDITVCPDKLDWGLSYDDGPSPYTPLLLDYRECFDD